MLKYDRTRAFGPWLAVATLAYFFLHFYNILYMLNEPDNSALLIYQFAGSMGLVNEVMPLFAALPAAAAFAMDWKSGFAVPAVLRAGEGRYLRSKIASAAVSGGLVALIGKLLFIVLLHGLYRYDPGTALEMFGAEDMLSVAFSGMGGYVLYFAGVLVVQFLAGAFWATSALAFSAFVPNILISVCVPLILYRLSIEVFYWTKVPLWANLAVLQDGAIGLPFWQTVFVAMGVFGGLTAILALVFHKRAQRRLEYA